MALFRRLFYKKPPDRLLEISNSVYVFDCCFSTQILEEDEYKDYIKGIVAELQDYFPESTFVVFNFGKGDNKSFISAILSHYSIEVVEYPRKYEGCPLLPLDTSYQFLMSSERFLSIEGQENVLLMHCERGGWPVLAFVLAGLLLYRKQYSGVAKTLEMVYKQAPEELLRLLSPVDPQPSHLRYLHYIAELGCGLEWPMRQMTLNLECVILREIPNIGEGGCRPVVRVYGQDPSSPEFKSSKVLFSTPRTKEKVQHYTQADCELIKITVCCHVQGDVVLECIHVDEDLEREDMMFRVMFNTAFVKSNALLLNQDEIDVAWTIKDLLGKDFRAEVLFSDFGIESKTTPEPFVESPKPLAADTVELEVEDDSDAGSVEEFFEAEEIFSIAEYGSPRSNFSTFDSEGRNGSETSCLVQNLKRINTRAPSTVDDVVPEFGTPVAGQGDRTLEISNSNIDQKIVMERVSHLDDNATQPETSTPMAENRSESSLKKDKEGLANVDVSQTVASETSYRMDPSDDTNHDLSDWILADELNSKLGHMKAKQDIENGIIGKNPVLVEQSHMLEIPKIQKERKNKLEATGCEMNSDSSIIQSKEHYINQYGKLGTDVRRHENDQLSSPVRETPSLNLPDFPASSEPRNRLQGIDTRLVQAMILPQCVPFNKGSDAITFHRPCPKRCNSAPPAIFAAPNSGTLDAGETTGSIPVPASANKAMASALPSMPARGSMLSLPKKMPVSFCTPHAYQPCSLQLLPPPPQPPPPLPSESSSNFDIFAPSTFSIAPPNQLSCPPSLEVETVRKVPLTSPPPPPPPPPFLSISSNNFPICASSILSTPPLEQLPSLPLETKVVHMAALPPPPPPPLPPPLSKSSVHSSSLDLLSPSYLGTGTTKQGPVFTLPPRPPCSPSPPPPPPPPPAPISSAMTSIKSSHLGLLSCPPLEFDEPTSTCPLASQPPSPPSPPPLPNLRIGSPKAPTLPILPKQLGTPEGEIAEVPPLPPLPIMRYESTIPLGECKVPPPPPPPPPPFCGANGGFSPLSSLCGANGSPPPPPLSPLYGANESPLPPSSLPPLHGANVGSPIPFVGAHGGPTLPAPLPSPLQGVNGGPPPPFLGGTNGGPPPPPPPPSLLLRIANGGPPPPSPPPFLDGANGGPPSPSPPPLLGDANGGPPPPPPPPFHGGANGGPPPPPPPPFLGGLGILPSFGHRAPPPPPPLGARGGAPSPPRPVSGLDGPPHPPAPLGSRMPTPPAPPGVPGAPPPPLMGIAGSDDRGLSPSPLMAGKGRGLSRSGASGSLAAPRKSSLKPLHWVKVTRAMQGSLWAELQKHGDAHSTSEFDVSELEKLFPAVVPKSNDVSKSAGQKAAGPKSDRVHLIELRRANNTEIMLTKIKMPLSDMMNAALSMDESILDVDQVENLIKFCPTKEEMEQLRNYTGDKENLGRCEQFFLELMKVPRMEAKLRVFSFKIQFNAQVSDLRKCLNIVNSACDEIRNSSKLKEIMKKILFLGNTLNQGTARGSAVGFRLDSLLKLTDTRATNNKMTLMHYLCKVIATRSPQFLDFHEDLVSLEAASKVQLKILAEEMQATVKGLERVEVEMTASENDGSVSEVFRKTLKEFLDVSGADVKALNSSYSAVGKNADALALYFGEDPARCPFEQVITTLLNFVRMFRKAHEENGKQAELDKKIAQKQAEMDKAKDVEPTAKAVK